MKKLFISLLAMAATVNAMAISFAGKATITLTSANNESCAIIVAESDELADGLNNGYYAVINMENREVALYAIYGGSNYQQFATKSLEDTQTLNGKLNSENRRLTEQIERWNSLQNG